ncbi:unknown protein [Microcystis aeruginosa NIES-843]|uniref:Uncharacterized protein n=1 Tax=Microcystis aeruginosa (strain NIES-843 / IAM M-2473) TaxID=449447 RepID=B0JU39_MICAN|nr:unknown protein [Microcystis aeruginosa NIES-843]
MNDHPLPIVITLTLMKIEKYFTKKARVKPFIFLKLYLNKVNRFIKVIRKKDPI